MLDYTEHEFLDYFVTDPQNTRVPDHYVRVMGLTNAHFFQYLIRYHFRIRMSSGYVWQDGWFFLTVKKVEEELKYNQRTQLRIIQKLAALGLVEMTRKGSNRLRHFRLSLEGIIKLKQHQYEQEIQEAENLRRAPNDSCDELQTTPPIYNSREISNTVATTSRRSDCDFSGEGRQEKKTPSPPKKKDTAPSKFDQRAAERLMEIVESHIAVNCRSNLRSWANQFRLMRTRDKIPKKDIQAAVRWYGKNIGQEFVPEAFSAATFRKKYLSIVSAMRRAGEGGKEEEYDDRWIVIAYRMMEETGDYDDPYGCDIPRDIKQAAIEEAGKSK